MDARSCMAKMKSVGTLSMATVDENGAPQIRCVSAVHYADDGLYFFTARGKEMAKQLLRDGRLQTVINTPSNEMVRMSGIACAVPESEQEKWIDAIFADFPFLNDIYPGETRKIGIVFAVKNPVFDYFNLGASPIERGRYTFSGEVSSRKGYRITDSCLGCGTCLCACPQRCIVPGEPYFIQESHCLHCGSCVSVCPNGAVESL